MKRAALCVAAIIVAGHAFALDLGGVELGSPMEALRAAHVRAPGGCSETNCTFPAKLGDLVASVQVSANDAGRVAQVLVVTSSAVAPSLLRGAREKWGAPNASHVERLHNLAGAAIPTAVARWSKGGARMMFVEHCGDVDHACLSLRLDSYSPPAPRAKL